MSQVAVACIQLQCGCGAAAVAVAVAVAEPGTSIRAAVLWLAPNASPSSETWPSPLLLQFRASHELRRPWEGPYQ